MLVRVDSGIDNVAKEVVHDLRQALRVHHAVQSTHEHSLGGVESLTRLLYVVTVAQNPRNDLYLQVKTGHHPQCS